LLLAIGVFTVLVAGLLPIGEVVELVNIGMLSAFIAFSEPSQFTDGAAAKIWHLSQYDIEHVTKHATMIVAEHAWIALVVTIATSLGKCGRGIIVSRHLPADVFTLSRIL
jgi:hypothetical protein